MIKSNTALVIVECYIFIHFGKLLCLHQVQNTENINRRYEFPSYRTFMYYKGVLIELRIIPTLTGEGIKMEREPLLKNTSPLYVYIISETFRKFGFHLGRNLMYTIQLSKGALLRKRPFCKGWINKGLVVSFHFCVSNISLRQLLFYKSLLYHLFIEFTRPHSCLLLSWLLWQPYYRRRKIYWCHRNVK